ncbi:MAG TPA: preprotein translocase subunit YajC [Candidatus Avichristensenella intestinipullorum]|uniref:Preprotein translocase subunit YajC n=1 Tax=Candidatus Avichristensenella intestinipullorum TaxID=2840693 RepID=A0A9D0YW18_9FIRM|nr:preprotein translocase subunit YajC [Candidatus Avichristensenella intestinipullorum]
MSTGATVLSTVISFLPMVLIIVVFYFLLIRPQRKKDKKVKEMLAALKVGDRVTTIGGIHGTIMGIKDDTITLGVGAEKTKLVFARWAIRNVDEVSIANDGETLV